MVTTATALKSIVTTAVIAVSLYAATSQSPSLYTTAITKLSQLMPPYIYPLTTDIGEVLTDDTGTYYLTWGTYNA